MNKFKKFIRNIHYFFRLPYYGKPIRKLKKRDYVYFLSLPNDIKNGDFLNTDISNAKQIIDVSKAELQNMSMNVDMRTFTITELNLTIDNPQIMSTYLRDMIGLFAYRKYQDNIQDFIYHAKTTNKTSQTLQYNTHYGALFLSSSKFILMSILNDFFKNAINIVKCQSNEDKIHHLKTLKQLYAKNLIKLKAI